jgi:hypothetical protein
MTDGINEPKNPRLLSEVTKGDYPTEAVHSKDGMFTIPEPEPASVDGEKMIQLESGLWIEKPNQKEIRILWTDTGAAIFSYECEESYEQIVEALSTASRNESGWTELTDPIFGFRITIPNRALLRPLGITTQLRDLEKLAADLKALEMQRRMERIQQASKDNSQRIVEQYKRGRQN